MIFELRVRIEINKLTPEDKETLRLVCQKTNPTLEDIKFLKGKSPLYGGANNNFANWFEVAQRILKA